MFIHRKEWIHQYRGVPEAPNLISPANGASNIALSPLLGWTTVTDAEAYNLNIALDSNFTTIIHTASNIQTASYIVPSSTLNIGTRYFWRVNAYNSLGTSPWSSVFKFTTVAPPPATTLLLPVNNAINISLTPLLDWVDVSLAASYRLQVATDSLFSNVIYNPINITGSQYIVPPPFLTYLSKYYWRVASVNGIGVGPWSVPFSFTTVAESIPVAPTLLSPANLSTGISLTPQMSWNLVFNAVNYGLQISTDLNFNNIVHTAQNTQDTLYNVPGTVLNGNTLYFWRVNASNNSGTGVWSAEWIFRTMIVGIENISAEIPSQYKLHNNYPNPFNPSTKIEFDLPEVADVVITVYDFLGRKVKDLVNQNLQAGRYRTEFNA
ncbi:MAG: hypothetical protein IPM38_10715 [Ignavibacteria bacterium]|nr:hypothetical protein [Ignavibacteria bacterium]